ncbi:hypothetical protein BVRB_6g147760 [Beta vulgaris subsp. vulgaris]|nr:hypothetical protein BVRB_6g147760 [Beta vulgaris subsp. vulgaris]
MSSSFFLISSLCLFLLPYNKFYQLSSSLTFITSFKRRRKKKKKSYFSIFEDLEEDFYMFPT